jgi:flagellar protein FliL
MSTPDPEKEKAEGAEGEAPKKGKSKLLLLGVPLVLLLGGGGGAYWYFFANPATAEAAAEEEPKEPPGIVAFEPFVVNLADEGGSRFFRVSLSLLIAGEENAKHVEESKVMVTRVRSEILELLATQIAEHLITPEGKAELKKAIAERATHALEHAEVTDVLFTEFVVQ